MKLNRIYFFILFLGLGTVLFSCKKDNEDTTPKRGDLISSLKMEEISTSKIVNGLALTGVSTSLVPQYNVDMYKLTYSTIDGNGDATIASGALFLPQASGTFPMLSYHHGTLTQRTSVPTFAGSNATEAMVGVLGASLGFISCLPDYIGLGVSMEVHPYLQSGLSASASIDMLLAVRNYCDQNDISYSKDLFICGYSEGGYVTMATQIELEKTYTTQFSLKASAPMAGPYDVETVAENLLSLQNYSSPALIGFLLYAYSEYYDQVSLSNVFNAPYAAQIPVLFDGNKDLATINASLSTNMQTLLNQSYVNDFKTNPSHALRLAFKENTLLNWNPKSPIRLYHSVEDEIVPYTMSVTTDQVLSPKSSSTVDLVTIQTGSHTVAAVPILLNAMEWFYTLK